MIPYERFYQSGVALRCLELGVPFVGPQESSLSELSASHNPGLASDDGDWVRAVVAATAMKRDDVISARDEYARLTDTAYLRFLDGFGTR